MTSSSDDKQAEGQRDESVPVASYIALECDCP